MACRKAEAEQERDDNVNENFRRRGLVWRYRRLNNCNVVDADRAGDADFFVALQKGVVELSVGVGFALVVTILDVRAILPVKFGLKGFNLCLEFALAKPCLNIFTLTGLRNARSLARN